MKNLIVFTLIFLFSNHLYAVGNWGQDTNCNDFFGEGQDNGSYFLTNYKKMSDKLAQQSALYNKFDDSDIQKCISDLYGFKIPFVITDTDKFATFRLTNVNDLKGVGCTKEPEITYERIETNHNPSDTAMQTDTMDDVPGKPTFYVNDKSTTYNAELNEVNLELKKLGNVSFQHYCAKNMMEAYSNYWAKKGRESLEHCEQVDNSVDLLSISKADVDKDPCTKKLVDNLKYSKKLTLDYIDHNKNLNADHIKLMNFDDKVYDEFKNNPKALQDAIDAANEKMALTKKIFDNGLDKIGNCMDYSNINNFVKDSFDDDPCSTSFGLDALANASIVDINEVVKNINVDYASDLAKKANVLSFKKNLENLLNYATPDVLELLKDEQRFCKSIGFVQGCLKQPGCNQNINNHIKSILDTDKGPYVDSEWINGSSVRYSKNQAKDIDIYDSHLCGSSNNLKGDYKTIFDEYKSNSTRVVQEDEAAQGIKNFNDFRKNINKACTKIVEGSDTESIEKIVAGKTISDEYLKFVNDNKDDFHVVGLLNALTADQRSVGTKFMDWVKSWTKNADNSHRSVPNTLGLCKFKVDGDRKIPIDVPELTADDFTNFKNQINGDLLKQLGSNSYLENPQASHDLLDLEIKAGECKGNVNSYLPIFHALRSHPASLAEYLRGEVNSAQKILKLKAVCQSIRCFNDYEEHKNDNVGYLNFIASSVRTITPKQAAAVKASARVIEEISDLAILSNKVQSAQGNFGDYVTLFYNGDIKNQDDLLKAIIDADKNLKSAEKDFNDFFKNLFKDIAMDLGETYTLGKIIESDKFKVALENNNLVKKLFPTADPILQQSLLKNYMQQLRNLGESLYYREGVSDFAVKALTLEVSRQFMLKKDVFKKIINDSELTDEEKKEKIDKVANSFSRAENYTNLTIEQVKEVTVEGKVDLIDIGKSVIKTESKLHKK